MEASSRQKPRHCERLINRRLQGDLGELSAMEWLVSKGALVWIPLVHSPDVDLMAEIDDRVLKVQVKTSVYRVTTSEGEERWEIGIATSGGNQSWTGNVKKFDPAKVDYLFVLVGDGRRWFIPAPVVESTRSITLGGGKFPEFEIEPGHAFESLVYSNEDANRIAPKLGEYPSGQRISAVNRTALPSQVRILPPPLERSESSTKDPRPEPSAPLRFQRTSISTKHQITIPSIAFRGAELEVGDRLHAQADGPGRITLERIPSPTSTPEAEAD